MTSLVQSNKNPLISHWPESKKTGKQPTSKRIARFPKVWFMSANGEVKTPSIFPVKGGKGHNYNIKTNVSVTLHGKLPYTPNTLNTSNKSKSGAHCTQTVREFPLHISSLTTPNEEHLDCLRAFYGMCLVLLSTKHFHMCSVCSVIL